MTNPTHVTRKSDRELVVTRIFDAPPRIVFQAWSKPELMTQWWIPKSMPMALLSIEMDVRVGGGYRLVFGHGEGQTMGRRLAEHLGHLRLRSVAHFLAQALVDRASDQLHRLGHVEGLGQVLEGAALESADRAVEVGVGGHDDDRQPGVALLDLGQQLDAGAAGHADVGDEHLRLVVLHGGQHVARVGEAAHGQFLARQCLLQHEADGLVVVNDPDGFHALPAVATLPARRR